MAIIEKKLRGIGDAVVYAVEEMDRSVAIDLTGQHTGYNVVVEGSSRGPGGPWGKLAVDYKTDTGGHEKGEGAFTVAVANEERHLAVDTRHPHPLTHVRVKTQQWSGDEHSYVAARLMGTEVSAIPEPETGPHRSYTENKGQILAEPSAEFTESGATAAKHVGDDYDQLMVGVSVTAVSAGARPTWSLETRGGDGVWYAVWTSEPLGGPGQLYVSIGAALRCDQMFGPVIRLAWFVPPGARVTFSASVVARASGD